MGMSHKTTMEKAGRHGRSAVLPRQAVACHAPTQAAGPCKAWPEATPRHVGQLLEVRPLEAISVIL